MLMIFLRIDWTDQMSCSSC